MSVLGGGGSATQVGISYQNRVAAWMAVSILAEAEATPLWELPANVTLKFLRCETEQPVDDILVGTSQGGHAFIQVKHSKQGLVLEKSAKSAFGSTIEQFVRQCFAYRNENQGKRPWERPLDLLRDRLVLITNPSSSSSIQKHLPAVLNKLRSSASDQTLDALASNQGERDALSTLRSHVTHTWQTVAGKELTDNEFRQISHLIYIQTLDVDGGGNDEAWAKDRLRHSILSDPTQADLAWYTLIDICGQFAINRSGGDLAILQSSLAQKGISLKPARSYRDDIERLKQYSRSTADVLSEFSKIRVGDTEVKIPRPVIKSLQDAATKGSLLVVGEPGAGKSGVIYEFAQSSIDRGEDVVFLAVDKLDATSSGTLRNEIGLEHELVEVLNNWINQQPGWLIIDALDAARSGTAVKMFRDLIAQVRKNSDRWRVVASIRKFDLRYGTELQQLFWGTPPTEFQDNEFVNICHLNVPQLSNDELAQIREQSEWLANFVDNARSELRDLLKVPFNLRLMADLIGMGVDSERFTPIQTQIELLDLYWQERVIVSSDRADFSDAREMLLRQAVEKMVDRRSLHVNRSEVLDNSALSPSLKQVLKDHVLVEWQPSPTARPDRYTLTFSHHVLFDYAVARLILRSGQQTPVERLEKDKELVLAIRPSLVFHFQHLWSFEEDRNSFWDLLFQVLSSPAIPEIGKLIGSTVVAESITQLSDCEPLLRKLEDTDLESNEVADQAFNHLVGALLSAPPTPNRPLTGDGAPPWCKLLERCTRSIRLPVACTVCGLLVSICEHPEQLTPEQRDDAGITSRRLLEFFWNQNPQNQWLVTRALEAVCRTFESDPKTSAALLRKCLEKEHLETFGFQEMYWLAEEVGRLIPLDAELIGDIYRAVFTYKENREIQTSIGNSRIVPLTSTASQDYQMARYQLARVYPKFLETAPDQATSALVGVIAAYVEEKHRLRELIEEQFDFNGQEAIVITDYSEIWDSDTYHDDEPLKILSVFKKYLQTLSREPDRKGELQPLINIIVSENRLAILWRHLLSCGTKNPHTLGQEIRYLAWAMPILTGYDTTVIVGDFITAIFSTLTSDDRERIERAILSIPDWAKEEGCEAAEYIRNRLLGCLPQDVTLGEETKQVLQELAERGDIPQNEPFFSSSSVTFLPFGEREFLTNQGVPVDGKSNLHIQELEESVKTFGETYRNSTPEAEEIKAIIPNLRSLQEALATADEDGVHPKQRDYAWGYLAEACEHIAKSNILSCEDGAGALAKQILLQASEYPDPIYHPESDEHFDDYPTWGSPAARIDAAQGLMQLVHHPPCLDEALLTAIERLSCDNIPAVRYQIATYLLNLYQKDSDLMWRIIERICREDQSRGVLQGILGYTLSRLADSNPDRVANCTKIIFDRITDGKGANKVRDFCTSIFTGLFLRQNHPLSKQIVDEIAKSPGQLSAESRQIVRDLRDYLTLGSIEPQNQTEDEVRKRAFDLMADILKSTIKAYGELVAKNEGSQFEAWSDEDREKMKQLVFLIDSIAKQLYFASGAFDDMRGEERRSAATLGDRGKKRFLQEASPILDQLADLAFPSIAHDLVGTLIFLVDVAPEDVFLRIGRVVQASQSGGYQYEYLAADLVVRFIERFLAEYRHILRENEECRNVLIEILDYFVQAGWSSARRLTYRMEEIFR